MNSRTHWKRPVHCRYCVHGIALIEALIALAVMVAGVAAIFSVHGFVAGGSAESRLQTAAMSLAQDKLEDLRRQDFDALADGEDLFPITTPGIGRSSTVNLRRCWTLETELSVTENGAAVPTLYRASATVVRAGDVCNTADDGLARMSSLIARQDPRVAARNVQELADLDGDGMLVDNYVPPTGVTPVASPGGFDLVKDTINGEEVLIAVVNPETQQAIVPKQPGGSLKVARINGNVFFKGERTVAEVRKLLVRPQGVAFCRIYYPETGGTSSDGVIFPNADLRESANMPDVPTIFDGATISDSTEIVSYVQYTCIAADNWRRAIAVLPSTDLSAPAERVCVGYPDLQPSAEGVYTGEDVLVWPGREYYGFRWEDFGDGPVRVRQGVRGAEDGLSSVMGSVCEKGRDCWGDIALRGLVPGGHHFFIDPKPVASVGGLGYTYCAETLETLARIDDGLHEPSGVENPAPRTALYAGLFYRNPEKVYCTNDKAYTGSLLDKLESDPPIAIPADDCLSYTRVGGFLSNMDQIPFVGSSVVLSSSSRFATPCAVMGGFGTGGGGYVCGFGERTQQVNIGAQALYKVVVGPIAGEWVPTVTDPVTSVPHDVVLMNFRVTDATAPALTVVGVISGDNLTISGTSQGVPLGRVVDLTITDSSSGSLTTTASIGAGGAYVSNAVAIAALADGELRIVATTSVNGTPIVAETVVVKGTSGLTLTGVISGTDLTISGTTAGVNTGQAVTLTITDQNNGSRSATAIVGSDGSYSTVVNVSGLASGLLTILANTVDSNNVALGATYQLNYDGGVVTSCNGVTVQTQAYNTNTRRMVAIEYNGTSYSGAGTCVAGSGNPTTFTCQVPSNVTVQINGVVRLDYQKKNANANWNSASNASTNVTVSSCSTITGVALP